ncbi:MAG: polymerase, sigma-24 subunit, subfamily, partial [Solirubrobacterales bacterium]|nr:polymerase, sigma-24 subunit, subfamily [Solirubrobacterales bacterium]
MVDVLREHAESLLRVARRHSFCADDAQDAYQRAVEIFLRHAATLDAAEAYKWVHTVVKHEAMRLRAQRARVVGGEDVDFDGHEAGRLPTSDEQLASFDLMTRSAEALQRLKPQELRALWLKAQGHSYQEIAELEGWTYTKVNRCITEGRRRFLDRYAEIGSGAECRRWEPVLSAMADGEASPREIAAVRPHLRHCPACRAHVRDLREADRRVAALLPVPVVAEVADHGGWLARIQDAVLGHVQERVVVTATKLQTGVEAALPAKLAVVAAGAAAIGGGVAVERAATRA